MSQVSNQAVASSYTHMNVEVPTSLLARQSKDAGNGQPPAAADNATHVLSGKGAAGNMKWKNADNAGNGSPANGTSLTMVLAPNLDPAKMKGNLSNLPPGLNLPLFPGQRPDAPAASEGGAADMLAALRGDSFAKGLKSDWKDGMNLMPQEPSETTGIGASNDAQMQSLIAEYTYSKGDNRSQSSEGFWAWVGDVLLSIVGNSKECPPGGGEAIDLLTAPALVETVTGDSKDLVVGATAVKFQCDQGYWRPGMPDADGDIKDGCPPRQTPDGDHDYIITPEMRAALAQTQVLIAQEAHFKAPIKETGVTGVSQPTPGGDVPVREKSLASNTAGHKDMTPCINPGSGDDGSSGSANGEGRSLTKPHRIPGVKDPAGPGAPKDGPQNVG